MQSLISRVYISSMHLRWRGITERKMFDPIMFAYIQGQNITGNRFRGGRDFSWSIATPITRMGLFSCYR